MMCRARVKWRSAGVASTNGGERDTPSVDNAMSLGNREPARGDAGSRPAAARRAAWWVIAARAIVALALVTGATEAILRLAQAEPYQYVEDAERGRLPRPGSSHAQRAEGAAVAHYNSLSLHDRDVGPRAPGEARVLVLGDSLTEAVEVADDENFCRRLEARLAARRPARVVNAGRMAYLAGEMIHTAEVLQPRLGAGAAVLVVRPESFGTDGDPRVLLPGFWAASYVRDEDGTVRVNKLEGVSTSLKRVPGVAWAKQHLALLDAGFSNLMARRAARAPSGPEPATDWNLIRRRVDFGIARLTALYGQRVLVVVISGRRVIDDPDAAVESSGERVIRESAAAAGVKFWSSRETFAAAFRDQHRLACGFANQSPPDVGHLNAYGHELTARALEPLVAELVP